MTGIILDVGANSESARRDLSALNRSLANLVNTAKISKKALGGIETVSLDELNRDIDDVVKEFKNLNVAGNRSLEGISNNANRAEKSMAGLGDIIKTAASALTAYLGLSAIGKSSDELVGLRNSLSLVSDTYAKLITQQTKLVKLAADDRSGISSTVSLYVQLTQALEKYEVSQERIYAMVDTIQKGVRLSGGNDASKEQGLTQLVQGISSGALMGEELRAVFEQLSYVSKGFQNQTGMTTGELKKLAAEGGLTTDRLVGIFESMEAVTALDFSKTLPTISEAIGRLGSALKIQIGEIGLQTGLTTAFAKVLLRTADYVDNFSKMLLEKLTAIKLIVNNYTHQLGILSSLGTYIKSVIGLEIDVKYDEGSLRTKLNRIVNNSIDTANKIVGVPIDLFKVLVLRTDLRTEGLRHTSKDLKDLFAGILRFVEIAAQNIRDVLPRFMAPIESLQVQVDRIYRSMIGRTAIFARSLSSSLKFGVRALFAELTGLALVRSEIDAAWVQTFKSKSISDFISNLKVLNSLRKEMTHTQFPIFDRHIREEVDAMSAAILGFAARLGLIDRSIVRTRGISKMAYELSSVVNVIASLYRGVVAPKIEPIIFDYLTRVGAAFKVLKSVMMGTFNSRTGMDLANVIVDGAIDVLSTLYDRIKELKLGSTISNALSFGLGSKGALSGISAVLKSILDFVISFGVQLYKRITEALGIDVVIAKWSANVVNAFDKVASVLSSLKFDPSELFSSFKDIGVVLTSLVSRAKKFGETIRESIGSIKGFISRKYQFVVESLTLDKLKAKLLAIKDYIPDFVFKLDTDAIANGIERIVELFKRIYKYTAESLNKAFTKVSEFGAKVKKVFLDVYDKIVGHSYWPDTIDGVVSYTDRLVKALEPIFAFVRKVIGYFHNLKESIDEMNVVDVMKAKLGTFLSYFKASVTSMYAAVKKLLSSIHIMVSKGLTAYKIDYTFNFNKTVLDKSLRNLVSMFESAKGRVLSVMDSINERLSKSKAYKVVHSVVVNVKTEIDKNGFEGIGARLKEASEKLVGFKDTAFVKDITKNVSELISEIGSIDWSQLLRKMRDNISFLLLSAVAFAFGGAGLRFAVASGFLSLFNSAMGDVATQVGSALGKALAAIAGGVVARGLKGVISALDAFVESAGSAFRGFMEEMIGTDSILLTLASHVPLLTNNLVAAAAAATVMYAVFAKKGLSSVIDLFIGAKGRGRNTGRTGGLLRYFTSLMPTSGAFITAVGAFLVKPEIAISIGAILSAIMLKSVSMWSAMAVATPLLAIAILGKSGGVTFITDVLLRRFHIIFDTLFRAIRQIFRGGFSNLNIFSAFQESLTRSQSHMSRTTNRVRSQVSRDLIAIGAEFLKGFRNLNANGAAYGARTMSLFEAFTRTNGGTNVNFRPLLTNLRASLDALKLASGESVMHVIDSIILSFRTGFARLGQALAMMSIGIRLDSLVASFRSMFRILTANFVEGFTVLRSVISKRTVIIGALIAALVLFASKASAAGSDIDIGADINSDSIVLATLAIGGLSIALITLGAVSRAFKATRLDISIGSLAIAAKASAIGVYTAAKEIVGNLASNLFSKSWWAARYAAIIPSNAIISRFKAFYSSLMAGEVIASLGALVTAIKYITVIPIVRLVSELRVLGLTLSGLRLVFGGIVSSLRLLKEGAAIAFLALSPIIGIFTKWASIAVGAGLLVTMMFGEGNTFFDKLEWTYDKIRSLMGLTPKTEQGRLSALKTALPDRSVAGEKTNFKQLFNNIDFTKVATSQQEFLADIAGEANTSMRDLEKIYTAQGSLNATQLEEYRKLIRDTEAVFARQPQKEGTGVLDGVNALNEQLLSVDNSAYVLFKRFLGWKPVTEEVDRSLTSATVDVSEKLAGGLVTGVKGIFTSLGSAIISGLKVAIEAAVAFVITKNWAGAFAVVLANMFPSVFERLKESFFIGLQGMKDAVDRKINSLKGKPSKEQQDQVTFQNAQVAKLKFIGDLPESAKVNIDAVSAAFNSTALALNKLKERGYKGFDELGQFESKAQWADKMAQAIADYEGARRLYEQQATYYQGTSERAHFLKAINKSEEALIANAKANLGGLDLSNFIGDSTTRPMLESISLFAGKLKSAITDSFSAAERRKLRINLALNTKQANDIIERELNSLSLNNKLNIQAEVSGNTDTFLRSLKIALPELYQAFSETSDELELLQIKLNNTSADVPAAELEKMTNEVNNLRKSLIELSPTSTAIEDINNKLKSMAGVEFNNDQFVGISEATMKGIATQVDKVRIATLELKSIVDNGDGTFYLKQIDALRVLQSEVSKTKAAFQIAGSQSVLSIKSTIGNTEADKALAISAATGKEIPASILANRKRLVEFNKLSFDLAEKQKELGQLGLSDHKDTGALVKLNADINRITGSLNDLANAEKDAEKQTKKLDKETKGFFETLSSLGLSYTLNDVLQLKPASLESLKYYVSEAQGIAAKLEVLGDKGISSGSVKLLKQQSADMLNVAKIMEEVAYSTPEKIATALSNRGLSDRALISLMSEQDLKNILDADKFIAGIQEKMKDSENVDRFKELNSSLNMADTIVERMLKRFDNFDTVLERINRVFQLDLTETSFANMSKGHQRALNEEAIAFEKRIKDAKANAFIDSKPLVQQTMSAPVAVENNASPLKSSIDKIVTKFAETKNLSVDFMRKWVAFESSGNPNAVSPTGPKGLLQLGTAASKEVGLDPNQRFDPWKNLEGGFKYLSKQLETFKDPKLAFAAYHDGPGAVRKFIAGKGSLSDQARGYAARVGADHMYGDGTTNAGQRQTPEIASSSIAAAIEPLSKVTEDYSNVLADLAKRSRDVKQDVASMSLARNEALSKLPGASYGELSDTISEVLPNFNTFTEGLVFAEESLRKLAKNAIEVKFAEANPGISQQTKVDARKKFESEVIAELSSKNLGLQTRELLNEVGVSLSKDAYLMMSATKRKIIEKLAEQLRDQRAALDNPDLADAAREAISKQVAQTASALETALKEVSDTDFAITAGKAFASNVSNSLSDTLKSALSGDIGIKDAGKQLLDNFTNTVIGTFVDGLMKPLTSEGSPINNVIAGFGQSIAGLGMGDVSTPMAIEGQAESQTSMFVGLKDGFNSVFTSMSDGFMAVFGSGGYLSKLFDYSFGPNGVLSGMFTGLFGESGLLSSLLSNVFDGISNLFSSNKVDAVGSALGIASSIAGAAGGAFGGSAGSAGDLFTSGGSFASAFEDFIPKRAYGGILDGPGTGTSDSILMQASKGEFVVNAESTRKNLDLLKMINEDRFPRFATGGQVGSKPSAPIITNRASKGSTQIINLTITGDISRQTRAEVFKMLPNIAAGVNSHNKEKGYRG